MANRFKYEMSPQNIDSQISLAFRRRVLSSSSLQPNNLPLRSSSRLRPFRWRWRCCPSRSFIQCFFTSAESGVVTSEFLEFVAIQSCGLFVFTQHIYSYLCSVMLQCLNIQHFFTFSLRPSHSLCTRPSQAPSPPHTSRPCPHLI